MKKVKRAHKVHRKSSNTWAWIISIAILILVAVAVILSWSNIKTTFNLPAMIPTQGLTEIKWGSAGTVPVSGDFDGDGQADLAVWNAANGRWDIRNANITDTKVFAWDVQWGYSATAPVSGDFDGDGKADLAVYNDKAGRWDIRNANTADTKVLAWNVSWGFADSKGLAGDFDGDGIDDLVVWGVNSSGQGNWYIYSIVKNENILWNFAFGSSGMTPFVGDFDGDGVKDIAVWNPIPQNKWYIYSVAKKQILLWDFWYGTVPPMVPVVGDFDGDSVDDIGLYGPDSGNWWVYSLPKQNNILWYYNFSGVKGGVPVPADYNGDGIVETAVYDAASGGRWDINMTSNSYVDQEAPIISAPQPVGIVNTTTIGIGIMTDEDAVCAYSEENILYPQVLYSSTENLFEARSAPQKVHNATIIVTSNGTKTYYINCMDGNNNYNLRNFNLTFFVNTSYRGSTGTSGNPDLIAPVISNLRPTGIINTTSTNIQVDTNENANCRYSIVNTAYENMLLFNTTGALAHSAQVFGLVNGTTANYFVRCSDTAGNVNSASALITFTVDFDYNGSIVNPSAITCVDSDGGLNYLVYGTANETGCSGVICDFFTFDSCLNSNTLSEAYCNASNRAEGVQYTCPYGCLNGACLADVPSVTGNNITINVTANPQIIINYLLNNYTLFITLRNNGSNDVASVFNSSNYAYCTDVGVGGTCLVEGFTLLFEYINATTGIVRISVTPAGTTINQTSVVTPPACVDSDVGEDYFTFGNSTGPTQPFNVVQTFVDSCQNATVLNEAICSPTYSGITQANCTYGCLNGACNTGCVAGETWNGVTCVNVTQQASCNVTECFYSNDVCLVYGYRILSDSVRRYCNNVNFSIQEPINSTCTWDNECESNLCGGGKCLELVGIASESQGVLNTILCWFQGIFGITNPNCPS